MIRLPVKWLRHDSPELQGRAITITGGGSEQAIPVPDGLILCDLCNDEIKHDPFPVLDGQALCKDCQKGIGIKDGDTFHESAE